MNLKIIVHIYLSEAQSKMNIEVTGFLIGIF